MAPGGLELKTWEQIEPWYQQLDGAARSSRPSELERWLIAAGELNAAVGQEGVERYVAMTCQTDDPEREAAYLAFVRDIEPKLKPIQNEIRNRYLDSPYRMRACPRDRYSVFDRALENRRALFREANIPRETELAELEQQYQKTIGAMTVNFQGQERTLAQMAPFLEETDRALRQTAWELVAGAAARGPRHARRAVRPDDGAPHRGRPARPASPATSITPSATASGSTTAIEDRSAFHDAVENVVVPLARQIQEQHREALGVDDAPPLGLCGRSAGPAAAAAVLATSSSWPRGPRRSSARSIPELGAQFAFLRAQDLLDLANRKGKAPGGYQTTLEDDRLPFIFMNAVGLDGDVRTLLHEGGHAFHTLASRGEPLAAYRESPIEFCEVASMTMELLGARDLEPFYDRGRRRPLLPQAARGDRR